MRHTQSLKKNEDFHKTMKKTNSNIELKNFYGGNPKPGSYPYTSGIYSNMYNSRVLCKSTIQYYGNNDYNKLFKSRQLVTRQLVKCY